MKNFKVSPLGDSQIFRNELERIKQEWNRYNSGVHPPALGYDYNAVFTSINLTETKVRKLLQNYPPQTVSFAQSSLSPETQQIVQRANQARIIAFYDDKTDLLTSCFGNFHPCKIEFGGRIYRSSESVFQAQKFTDQIHIMTWIENTDAGGAVKIARENSMTPHRMNEWDSQMPHVNKVDVMKNVLRAKFGQNPDLKEKLMATGSSYLVEHLPDTNRRDRFWSDAYDGTGQNQLGICLMELRAEHGGRGIINKSRVTDLFYQNLQSNNSQPKYQAPQHYYPQTPTP